MSVTDVVRPVQPVSFDQKFAGEVPKYARSDCKNTYKPKRSMETGYDPIKAENAIQQFRNAVKDCELKDSSDEYLVKWLIAQDFDVSRAEKMLRQSLEWRRTSRADVILESYTPCEVLEQHFSMGHVGLDTFGCPVFICALGKMDLKGLLASMTKKEYYNFLTWMLETFVVVIAQENNRTGCRTRKQTFIIDLDQFSMRHLTSKPVGSFMNAGAAILVLIQNYLVNYPDQFRRVFIINAPSMFPWLFSFIKPLLAQNDVPKFKIFGSNKKEWISALQEEIDSDQFPSYYGGSMTDPNGDPKCPSKLNLGGEVPRFFYLRKNPPVAKDYMETLSISAGIGGKKKLEYNVDVIYSSIRWEFMTEGGDISYRVYNKNNKNNSDDLVPQCRVDSHLVMEEGLISCDQPGKYVFEFDNSYSYLRKKKLRYHIVVEQHENSQ
ncbi:SEC14-like protein 2 isoform X2 [Daphnia carinata]|uniref:SEC14-like protein 2 isoform X2 n=1 Tax=Daphnia carinata TaxID=120202 RepID=UPI00257CCA82|nr:SEC14-like protein 2 isoform X2 [Daphnia carinata]